MSFEYLLFLKEISIILYLKITLFTDNNNIMIDEFMLNKRL